MFHVLGSNDLAMNFYRKLNAMDKTETRDIHVFFIQDDGLQQLAAHSRAGCS